MKNPPVHPAISPQITQSPADSENRRKSVKSVDEKPMLFCGEMLRSILSARPAMPPQIAQSPADAENRRKSVKSVEEKPMLFCGDMVRALMPRGQCAPRKTQTRRIVNLSARAVLSPEQRKTGFEFKVELARYDYPVKGLPRLCIPERHPADAGIPWEDCGCSCLYCPQGEPGTHLWVKETFRPASKEHPRVRVEYQADMSSWGIADAHNMETNEVTPNAKILPGVARPNTKDHWKPSIFMPRWASRITLEILAIRVERLQDISREDAILEGVDYKTCPTSESAESMVHGHGVRKIDYIGGYRLLWNSLNLKPKAVYSACANDGGPLGSTIRKLTGYISHPWSDEDFDGEYPSARQAGTFKGKPLTVISNPWVWVIEFKRISPQIAQTSADSGPEKIGENL